VRDSPRWPLGMHGSGSPQSMQVPNVCGDGLAHGLVFHVVDVAFEADLADDLADLRVVYVGDFGEEMVLDLKVEAAEEPGDDLAVGGEVGGGVDLVDGKLVRQPVRGVGQGKLGPLDGVGELEDDGEGDTGGECGDRESDERTPDTQTSDGNDEEEAGVQCFSGPELEVFERTHRRHGHGADSFCEIPLVIDLEDPGDVDHHVEEPAVEMLKAVHLQSALVLVDAHEIADVDVVVDALDVGEGVVEDAVLDLPDIGASAETFEGGTGKLVEPGSRTEAAVAAVVHYVEAGAGDKEAKQHALRESEIPCRGEEDEMDVESDHASQDEKSLDVELAVPLAL